MSTPKVGDALTIEFENDVFVDGTVTEVVHYCHHCYAHIVTIKDQEGVRYTVHTKHLVNCPDWEEECKP